MSAMIHHQGTAVFINEANIDTDQIIPKQFLTGVTRKGYGKHLFHDWRYLDLHEQEPNPEFNLNKPQFQGASILVTRDNFGCGSSREHAPWALKDFGLHVIIAPSYADIFYANAFNNFMLPIVLDNEKVDKLIEQIELEPKTLISIDIQNQSISTKNIQYYFELSARNKYTLLNGLDSIGLTLSRDNEILRYEESAPDWL